MGSFFSGLLPFLFTLAVKRDGQLTASLSKAKPFISPSDALNTMPRLFESRPWRFCTDANGTAWHIVGGNTTTLASRDAHTRNIPSEAYTLPEWIMCQLPSSVGEHSHNDTEALKVIYHVPYLEAWADAASDLNHRGKELTETLRHVAKAVAGDVDESTNFVQLADGTVAMTATEGVDADEVDARYRSLLDVKPGLFGLGLADGNIALECPMGIAA